MMQFHRSKVAAFLTLMGIYACTSEIRYKEGDAGIQWPESFGFGSSASSKVIDSIDFDVQPNGIGLPPGSGTYSQGKEIFAAKCAACHGRNGNDGPYSKLVTVTDTASGDEKTIGNYWPYATTLYDYVYRAMPFDAPGSLTYDEVYAITSFLLVENRLVDSTTVIDRTSLPLIQLPAKVWFVADDRESTTEVR